VQAKPSTMSRNQVRTSTEQGKRVAGQLAWLAIASYGGIAISIALFTWFYEQALFTGPQTRTESILTSLSVVGLHMGLVVALERLFVNLPMRRKLRYRTAFLVSVGLGWALWVSVIIFSGRFTGLFLPVFAFSGAFFGGLVATAINENLWENNSPPSTRIQTEVHQRHLEVTGIPAAGSWTKRCFDLCLAIIGVAGSAPVWGLISFLVWFEDPGPILFVKNSVGKGGRNFHQYKFRTMVRGAEVNTGPVLSREGDDRVLLVGRLLRKTALDELPQVINILKGEMSFVGPRPQRTVLVHDYLAAMPEYAERHRVLPGLSGLAQVAGDYYLTPRQKLRFDRLYIQNLSLGNDIKLLFLACLITFWFRWRKGWTGRLPRRLLKLGVSEERFS
jgi:lipopolysaccharide/colanic/teichoic acid biosynthesis glycosyltransferase